jgi:hypothetical protein
MGSHFLALTKSPPVLASGIYLAFILALFVQIFKVTAKHTR